VSRSRPADVKWIREQLADPATMYTIAEMVRLCGGTVSTRRLRRILLEKGVIEGPSGKGKEHVILVDRLQEAWPDLWLSIARAQKMKKRADDDAEYLGEAA
jgi:hypothetical protein